MYSLWVTCFKALNHGFVFAVFLAVLLKVEVVSHRGFDIHPEHGGSTVFRNMWIYWQTQHNILEILQSSYLYSLTIASLFNPIRNTVRQHIALFYVGFYKIQFGGHDSSVGIATRYGLDGPGIESRWGARFSASVQTGPGAHPASCAMGTGFFRGIKRPGRGAYHPPPTSVPRS